MVEALRELSDKIEKLTEENRALREQLAMRKPQHEAPNAPGETS